MVDAGYLAHAEAMSGSMSGSPKSGHDWGIYDTHPSLTPLTDLGRLPRQAPLHRLRAAGSGASVKNINVARYLGEQLPRSLICPKRRSIDRRQWVQIPVQQT
jgi:hypothetical protein